MEEFEKFELDDHKAIKAGFITAAIVFAIILVILNV